MRLLLSALLLTLPLCAELRKVEMTLGGLDCDSCSASVDRVVKRIRGVDVATYDEKAKVVTVTFKPDNTVKLSAIRDAVKGVGYTPGETKIVARGTILSDQGAWTFQVAGPETSFKAELPNDLKKAATDVVVEGVIPEKSPDTVQIQRVRPN